MDVQLLRCYDKAQNIDALYREILRNTRNEEWHPYNYGGLFYRFDHLQLHIAQPHYIEATTNENWWIVEKWIKLT